MEEYTLVHAKRNRGSKKPNRGQKSQNQSHSGGFSSSGHHNEEQRKGQFSFDTIHGLKLKEVEYKVPSREERKEKRAEFNGVRDETGKVVVEGVRSKFIKHLVQEQEAVLVERLGLTEKDLDGMREGFVPNGFNVHHKLALHGGGKNEFSNFILTPLYPHDQWHHDVMDPQMIGLDTGQSRNILIPYTDEMIYNPKEFGFTKENQPVKPNYTSNVNPTNYPDLYKPEHISVSKREKDMAGFYAELEAKKAERAKANNGGKKAPMTEVAKKMMAKQGR